jgi:hypothetical protein
VPAASRWRKWYIWFRNWPHALTLEARPTIVARLNKARSETIALTYIHLINPCHCATCYHRLSRTVLRFGSRQRCTVFCPFSNSYSYLFDHNGRHSSTTSMNFFNRRGVRTPADNVKGLKESISRLEQAGSGDSKKRVSVS